MVQLDGSRRNQRISHWIAGSASGKRLALALFEDDKYHNHMTYGFGCL